MVAISVNPLGCSPMVRANNKGECIEILNQAAQLFNLNLKTLVDDIKPQIPLSNIVFLNSYNIINDIISQPASQGTVHYVTIYNQLCLLIERQVTYGAMPTIIYGAASA